MRATVCLTLLLLAAGAPAAPALPAIGEWDGVTASAKLDGPYEDPRQANVPFGIISYFNQPWRAYMDTWPASKFLEVPGCQWNIEDKYAEPMAQILSESGIRAVRVEIGWGSVGWDDDLMPHVKARLKTLLPILQKHGIRPLILLNAHHGMPCPVREVPVEVTADAKKGDRILKLKSGKGIRAGYTGVPHPSYIAAYPLITGVDDDGTAHLSAGLGKEIKAGPFRLQELKYQPFQGTKLKDGTPVPAAQETADGWLKYAAAVGRAVREALGTQGKPDAGFDIEVWNEQTFGSNFLDINRYYDEKRQYAEPFVYRKTRPFRPGYRPDARLQFEQKDCYAILPMTIDYYNDPANGFPGVRVISGFSNQWPWDNGKGLWDGQAGFSRHYYTGGWVDCTPEHPLGKGDSGTIDALGNFDGKKQGREWHSIVPGSNFVPTFRMGFPEFFHSGFKTEMITRDVIPDSRLSYFAGHGRYTHNGDFRTAQVWQTEVNYDRAAFFDKLVKETGAKRDDPRLLALDEHMAGKMLLRQYLFHAHKGLYRIMIFCPEPNTYSLGMFPKALFTLLDKTKGEITPEVRAAIPPEFAGMAWLTKLMETGEKLDAPRPLQVKGLVEYKPRLVFAGDGTPAHPSRWNRDQFAFLPFQLDARRYVIPYYVVTLDVTHSWDRSKDALDPARYDMPEQEFDVTIGNVAGRGARVSCYDPLTNKSVPAKVVAATPATLTVRVRSTDYPRVLQVTEARPGPQILDPKVSADAAGKLTVSWRTNVPVAATVTYGRDWENRSARQVDLPAGKSAYSVSIPTGLTGVLAARIEVQANGLTDVWPRWDEDPAGQVVTPGTQPQPAGAPAAASAPPALPDVSGPTLNLSPVRPLPLPVAEANDARGCRLDLPRGAVLAGPPDAREGTLAGGISLRIAYLPGAGKSAGDYLPFAAPADEARLQPALTASGVKATLATYRLAAAAHPGMANLSQSYLLVPMGRDGADLLLVAATGTPAAMQAQEKVIQAVFASVRMKP